MRHHPPLTAGQLEVTPPARLLMSAFARRLTGTLTLRRERFEKRIDFHDGQLVAAASNQPSESLGTLLVCQGWIDVQTYAQSLAKMDEGGRRHGEILVDLGAMRRERLAQALRLQALARLSDAGTWARGTYAFTPGPVKPHGRPYPLWNVLQSSMLQRHGRARIIELARARGESVCVLRRSVLSAALAGLAEPLTVLGRVDGVRTVSDIVRAGEPQLLTFVNLLVLRQLDVVGFKEMKITAPSNAPSKNAANLRPSNEPGPQLPAARPAVAFSNRSELR